MTAGAIRSDKSTMQCPNCHTSWRNTIFMSAAHQGGGYRVNCLLCNHFWDDHEASYEERSLLREEEKLRLVVCDYENDDCSPTYVREIPRNLKACLHHAIIFDSHLPEGMLSDWTPQ